MPRKKKPDRPQWNFQMFFDDSTMSESEGEYSRVKELMEEDVNSVIITPYGGATMKRQSVSDMDWCVKSRVSIVSQFGTGNLLLDFYHDKRVYIVGYAPSINDIHANPDLRMLTAWCIASGWKIPQPTVDIVRTNPGFWKHMWDTLQVDSDFLDKKHGKRKQLMPMKPEVDDWEDDEEEPKAKREARLARQKAQEKKSEE